MKAVLCLEVTIVESTLCVQQILERLDIHNYAASGCHIV